MQRRKLSREFKLEAASRYFGLGLNDARAIIAEVAAQPASGARLRVRSGNEMPTSIAWQALSNMTT